MSLKEKAKELVDRYNELFTYPTQKDKKCELIAFELHLEKLSKMKLIISDREIHYKYWQEVKQEIEKL